MTMTVYCPHCRTTFDHPTNQDLMRSWANRCYIEQAADLAKKLRLVTEQRDALADVGKQIAADMSEFFAGSPVHGWQARWQSHLQNASTVLRSIPGAQKDDTAGNYEHDAQTWKQVASVFRDQRDELAKALHECITTEGALCWHSMKEAERRIMFIDQIARAALFALKGGAK